MGLLNSIFGKRSAQRHVLNGSRLQEAVASPTPSSMKEYIKKDPVLASNLRQIITAILEKDPKIDAKPGKTVSEKKIEIYNEQLENVEIGEILKNALPSAFWNGNMFLEAVVLGGKLKELYVIDPETIKLTQDEYGNVVKIEQITEDGDIELDMERIIHIRMPSLQTGSWGESYLKPLEFALARKEVAENYLAGMIENLNPVLFLELLDSANEESVIDMKSELRAKRNPLDPAKILGLLKGEKVGRVDLGTTDNFDAIHKYIDYQNEEIIRILQIPPIVAGTVDNSNRSNSEIQERAVFGRTITTWQEFLVKKLNKLLIKEKLGWKDVTFEFPMLDMRKQEAAIIRALKLKELGLSNDVIHKHLNENGIKVDNDFVKMESGESTSKQMDEYESRQPRDKGGIPQNEEDRLKSRANGMEMKSNG